MKTLLISGYDGRMGQETVRLAASYGFDAQPFNPDAPGDVIIDFSHPDLLPSLLKGGLPLVIGTTGFSPIQRQAIQNAAAARPIFLAANFSPGIWVLQRLAAMAGELLPGWDAALIERHHAKKHCDLNGECLYCMDGWPRAAFQLCCVTLGKLLHLSGPLFPGTMYQRELWNWGKPMCCARQSVHPQQDSC